MILAYDCLPGANGLGQCIVRIVLLGGSTILIGMNPRTATAAWAARLTPGDASETIDPATLPYSIRDLAETLCRERFPIGNVVR